MQHKFEVNRFGINLFDECASVGIPVPAVKQLLYRLNEPQRYYHNEEHLCYIIKNINDFGFNYHDVYGDEKISTRKVLIYATLFHDIVYEVGEKDNEEKSINELYVMNDLWSFNLTDAEEEAVEDCIRQTINHFKTPEELEISSADKNRYVVDIFRDLDLIAFAAPPVYFDKLNCIDLVNEFIIGGNLPTADVYAGKLKFMNMALGQKPFFRTQLIRDYCEHRVELNVKRHIEWLKKNLN